MAFPLTFGPSAGVDPSLGGLGFGAPGLFGGGLGAVDRLGMSGMGACPGCAMSNPMAAQMGMMQQQQQMLMFMLGLLMGLMAAQPGLRNALQGAGLPGLNGGGGGGFPGALGGGGGASGGGGGAPGVDGGSSAGGASASGGVPYTNYNGPINVDKVVNALDPAYRENAKKHFPGILAECERQGVTDKAQIAYILATTVHESGAGKYMEEIASGSAYEGRRDLGNTQSGDGVRYKGRGYVQITGRNNYTNWSKKLGIDLVGNPELAEQPATAARILVQGMKEGSFTGKKLSDYIGNGKADFVGARRIVNGTDKASTFAATAQKILAALG